MIELDVYITAVIALLGVAVTGIATVFGIALKSLSERISDVEKESIRLTQYNRRLWYWARRHLDLYYRYRIDGSPDPEQVPHE